MSEDDHRSLRRIYDALSRLDVDELLRDVAHDCDTAPIMAALGREPSG